MITSQTSITKAPNKDFKGKLLLVLWLLEQRLAQIFTAIYARSWPSWPKVFGQSQMRFLKSTLQTNVDKILQICVCTIHVKQQLNNYLVNVFLGAVQMSADSNSISVQ